MQDQMKHPISLHAQMMGNVMYLHKILGQPKAPQFVEALAKKVYAHIDRKNWAIVPCNTVPKKIEVVPSVWAMCCKRNLTTNKGAKHKARLLFHEGKQAYSIDYFETYAPVVTWFAIHIFIIIAINYNHTLRQIDFVQAYTQAPIEMDIHMKIP